MKNYSVLNELINLNAVSFQFNYLIYNITLGFGDCMKISVDPDQLTAFF